MHTWYWCRWEGLPYLRCDLLDPWPHGFFTQLFWPRLPHEIVAAIAPQAEVYRVKQVHGNTVLSTSEAQEFANGPTDPGVSTADAPEFALADGLVSDADQQAIWVCSADCTPALIADVVTGQVSAIHAGWRGTAAKIIPVAIARLQAQGSHLENLRVAMGPAISGAVYQVSADVAVQVGTTIAQTRVEEPDALLAELQALPQPPILPDEKPGHVKLDVRRINALQLEQLGLQPEQIAIAPHCTFQQPDQFFSYRRDGLKKVQWSGIVSQLS